MDLKKFILNNKGHAQHGAEREFHYQLIKDALALTNGNRSKAAELLGISRVTLLSRIRMYDIVS